MKKQHSMLLLLVYGQKVYVCVCEHVSGGGGAVRDLHTEPLKPGSITNAGPQKAIILTN